MDKEAYLSEAYRQLNNQNYYKKLDEPIYKNNVPKLNKILEKLKNEKFITDKQFDYLRASENDRLEFFTCYLKFISLAINGRDPTCQKAAYRIGLRQ